ncbi:hypothetical protein PMZ80_002660 [Knufia obscura]|uniref:Metallo-beta-lactamase domain-containing protein n=2 Tax=Knufia TaxID=430999 RepID=A0AAN8I2K5_9EURO|nr:hypothetical protein PMZ80_002660 [Knufia obscura]KAK5951437.1 hypothetical protein OHC33_007493 [Knufia fluminis]
MAHATVHALSTGSLTLPERFFITPADNEAKRTVPSLSFLIQHRSADGITTRLVFDLGLRRDTNLYPSVLQKHIASRSPVTTHPDAVASLAKGGLNPSDINFILFSHVHYDHVGLPSDFSSPTKFIVGPGALDLLSGKTQLNIGSHSFFEPDLLPPDRTIELPTPTTTNPILEATKPLPLKAEAATDTPLILTWSSRPLLPFKNTIDLFGDGTIYILNAPGHLPGHINLLIRTSSSSTQESPKFVLLAGDACHDIRLFTGERDIATWQDDSGRQCCIHYDIPRAKETIGRLARVQREGIETEVGGVRGEVEVVFAHNWEWEGDAVRRGRFWPGRL